MIVMTTLFRLTGELASDRLKEFRYCIEKNADNPIVEKLHVLWERKDPIKSRDPKLKVREHYFGDPFPFDDDHLFLNHPKITVHICDGRPMYSDFIRVARDEHLEGKVIAICNTDIWTDETLALAENIQTDTIYAITRHNWDPGKKESTGLQGDGLHGSQDTWIFRHPLRPFQNEIYMGVLGCDSYFAQKAIEMGITVINPCRQIKTYHLHTIGWRNNTPGGKSYWDSPDYMAVCIQPSDINAPPAP